MRSLFAMELSIRVDGHRLGLVDHLRSFGRQLQAGASRQEKAAYWQAVAQTLLRELPSCARGIWDYSDHPQEADAMFRDYADALKTKKGARSTPSIFPNQGPMRGHGGALYCNVTFAWLVVTSSSSGRGLAKSCSIDRGLLWKRETFRHLLQLVPHVLPGHIQSDVYYVIPGDASFALTDADLDGRDFTYLRRLKN